MSNDHTQQPTRKESPTREESPENAPPHHGHIVPIIDLQTCKDAPPSFFTLLITKVEAKLVNYDPANAVDIINAILQHNLATLANIPDLPPALFRILFLRPNGTDTGTFGAYACRIPAPLMIYIADLTAPKNPDGPLVYASDEGDNTYKMELTAYVAKDHSNKAPRPKNDLHWMHIDTNFDLPVTERDFFDIVSDHIGKYGMTIQDHSRAFYQQTTRNGERSKGIWHCEYDIDTTKIPTTGGYWDITGLQCIPIGYDANNNYAKVRIRRDLMQTLFSACPTCWKHLEICPVHGKHGDQGSTSAGKKRANNNGNNASFAADRMAKKAAAAQTKKHNF